MQTYQVTWTIEVEAETPLEAAQLARESQEEGTEALFFEVEDTTGAVTGIDLLHYT
jgi:hypothetical protein